MQKYLLVTNDFGRNIQENINNAVTDGKYNNAAICRALNLKNKGVLNKSNPLTVTCKNVKKFDVQNPIIGKVKFWQVKLVTNL